MRQKTEVHFLVGTVILGFLSIFKKSQASAPFEALHTVCLSRGQSDVRPSVLLTFDLLLTQGLSGSIPLETKYTGSLSHIYC